MPLNLRPFPRDYPEFDLDAAHVEYREIFAASAEIDHTHARQSDAANQFARVKMRFEPSSRTMSNVFINEAAPGAVPADFVAGVEKGIRAIAEGGLLRGFPVVACKATLLDGAFHDTDSSLLTFELAARAAVREAAAKAGIKLLEPYIEVNITTPETVVGTVIGDFKARRGVCNQSPGGPGAVAIYGFAPLANMTGYADKLASQTGGAATFSWKPAGLEEVPGDGGEAPFGPAAAARA